MDDLEQTIDDLDVSATTSDIDDIQTTLDFIAHLRNTTLQNSEMQPDDIERLRWTCGKIGCRLHCPLPSRRKPEGKHYYPVLLKPNNYNGPGCNHGDIDIWNLSLQCKSPNLAQKYRDEHRRRETGIGRPSIFDRLPPSTILGIPSMFPGDCMHIVSLNITDLLLGLWRGTIACDPTDVKTSWAWAVLCGQTWQQHTTYWKNYCKLVTGVRLLLQRSVSPSQLKQAQRILIGFVIEFEHIYVQRQSDRIHFVCQSIHYLTHMVPETSRVGPNMYYSQWPIERTIGNLGEELKQHSNPYRNFSERCVLRSQVNALKAMAPQLDRKQDKLPRGAVEIGDGYILLCAMDNSPHALRESENDALKTYIAQSTGTVIEQDDWSTRVVRWSRVLLPKVQRNK